MPPPTDWDCTLAAVAAGATLVTANSRLARRALGDEASLRHAAGGRVWRRGDVLPWTAWLKRLQSDALAAGVIAAGEPSVLLSAAQGEALWRRIIEADASAPPLLQPAVAARHAADAYALCLAWGIDRGELAAERHHEDVAAFLRWSESFDAALREHGWIVPAALADCAPVWLQRDERLRPSALYLAGFEELTPQQQSFLEQLAGLGVPVYEVTASPQPSGTASAPRAPVRVGCADAEAEMIAAADWARRRLEDDPGALVGIVVPDLAARRAALARHLDAALDAPARRRSDRRRRRAWNVSLGLSLADEPLVHDALLLLAAAGGRLSFVDASRLLRSPFLAAAERERTARLRAEHRLRELGEARLDTVRFARLIGGGDGAGCGELASRIEQVIEASAGAKRRAPRAWAEHFAELLRLAGWPGERGLDSREYQALGAWERLLGELAALGAVLPAIGRSDALDRLRRLAAERTFQEKSPAAPVQVLGLLEALGQRFDALWVMGLHDEVWPQTPRPNPFLPLALQRERGLPHATAARELAFAERVTGQLLASAPEVVTSWPRNDADRALRPSPLITTLPETDLPPVPADDRRAMLAAARFETLEEERGPAVLPTDRVGGGTRLLRDQSQCPFRAFAVHRLRAEPLPSPEPGLDPMQRGHLVHRILDRLWTRLQTRSALAGLDESERRRLVAEAVSAEVARMARHRPSVFTPRFTEVECRRLESLVDEWLTCELARPEFRVAAREQGVPITIGLLKLRGRIDRIDELPDGGLVLIDYKTGRGDAGPWLDERPDDPQLPLYALRYGDDLAGLVIGEVRTGRCRWAGVTRDDGVVPGARAVERIDGGNGDWDALRERWRATAERLAADVLDGQAGIDPLPGVCPRCHLAGLCRIGELRAGFVPQAGQASEALDD